LADKSADKNADKNADRNAAKNAEKKLATGPDNVVVIGLGRFGGAVADSLVNLGHEVLGIDSNAHIVQDWSDRLTHVVEADATDTEAMRQLGVQDFSRAVVGIGTHLEASVLTVLTLAEIGVPEIWAKAISVKHGKILSSVGARHVIFPESEMGERVAHLITGRVRRRFCDREGPLPPGGDRPHARGHLPADQVGCHGGRHQTAGRGLHVRTTRDGRTAGLHPDRGRRHLQGGAVRRRDLDRDGEARLGRVLLRGRRRLPGPLRGRRGRGRRRRR
jgi:hypothetical protein